MYIKIKNMNLNVKQNAKFDRYHDAEINIFCTLGAFLLYNAKKFISNFNEKYRREYIDSVLNKYETDENYNKIKEYININGDWMRATKRFLWSSDGVEMLNNFFKDFDISFKADYRYITNIIDNENWI